MTPDAFADMIADLDPTTLAAMRVRLDAEAGRREVIDRHPEFAALADPNVRRMVREEVQKEIARRQEVDALMERRRQAQALPGWLLAEYRESMDRAFGRREEADIRARVRAHLEEARRLTRHPPTAARVVRDAASLLRWEARETMGEAAWTGALMHLGEEARVVRKNPPRGTPQSPRPLHGDPVALEDSIDVLTTDGEVIRIGRGAATSGGFVAVLRIGEKAAADAKWLKACVVVRLPRAAFGAMYVMAAVDAAPVPE